MKTKKRIAIFCFVMSLIPITPSDANVDNCLTRTLARILGNPTTKTVSIQPKLSSHAEKSFNQNLKWMGVSAERFDANLAGGPDQWKSALYVGVGMGAKENPIQRELYTILVSKHSSPQKLKSALNRWSTQNQLKMNIAFPDDVYDEAKKLISQKELSPDASIISDAGFINEKVFVSMVSKGRYPVADPHDIFMHLPSFAVDGFSEQLIQQAKLTQKIAKELGHPSITEVMTNGRKFPRGEATRHSAYSETYRNMIGVVRENTHENMSYLQKSAGQARLVLQGGPAYNALVGGILKDDRQYFLSRFLDRRLSTSAFADEQVKRLSEFEAFRVSAEGSAITERYLQLLEQNGSTRETFERAVKKFDQFLKAENKLTQGSGSGLGPYINDEVAAEQLLQKMANWIESDPQLKKMFEVETKKSLIETSNQFYESYLKWVDSRYLKST